MARYRWDTQLKKLVPVKEDMEYTARQGHRVDLYMAGMRTIDGVDISSKRKRQEYMKATGVADTSDFSPDYYEKVRKERQAEEARDRREDIGRAAYQVLDRRK